MVDGRVDGTRSSSNSTWVTWVLCANEAGGKLYQCRNLDDGLKFYRDLSPSEASKDFVRYLAEELEVACGSGTDSRLILCANDGFLDSIVRSLSPLAREAIIGLVHEDLYDLSDIEVYGYVRSFIHHPETPSELQAA